jgi:hypothetical protein
MSTMSISQSSKTPAHRSHQIVDGCLWNIVPLFSEGGAEFTDIARNGYTLPYLAIHNIPKVLYGRHVWRIGRPGEDWDLFSLQKLCAYPGNMRASIVLLERDVMESDKWHNNRSQYLISVSC